MIKKSFFIRYPRIDQSYIFDIVIRIQIDILNYLFKVVKITFGGETAR